MWTAGRTALKIRQSSKASLSAEQCERVTVDGLGDIGQGKYTKSDDINNKSVDNGTKSGIIEEEVAIPSDKVNNFFLKPKAKHAEEFFSVGYTKDDGEILSKHLREGFDYSKAVDKRTGDDGSERFSVFMDLGVDKKRRFRIVWQKDTPNSKPRLITGHREDD